MKKILCVIALLAMVSGCAKLQSFWQEGSAPVAENQAGIEAVFDAALGVAGAVDPLIPFPVTKTVSTVLALAAMGLAWNRDRVARRRKGVIIEVNEKRGTPDIKDQVTSTEARKEVAKLIK